MPHANFTYTGQRIEGFSGSVGITEAGHRCLQLPDCGAVVESPFTNPAHAHVMRYVLRKAGGTLVSMPGTNTITRSASHCNPPEPPSPPSPSPPPPQPPPPPPPPPPLPPPPPPPPPSSPPPSPTFVMQTRPAYIVRFVATVSTPLASFDVPAYVERTRALFNTESVGVTVAAGSVIVTTELGTDDEATADGLVDAVNDLGSDALDSLFDAPAVVDSVTSQANPDAAAPPSGPPTRSDDDHVVLSIVIICIVLVPVGIFFAYLWFEKSREASIKPGKPRSAKKTTTKSKPYTRVTTKDEYNTHQQSMSDVRFKFEF